MSATDGEKREESKHNIKNTKYLYRSLNIKRWHVYTVTVGKVDTYVMEFVYQMQGKMYAVNTEKRICLNEYLDVAERLRGLYSAQECLQL